MHGATPSRTPPTLAPPVTIEVERVAKSLTQRRYVETRSTHEARAFTDPWGITVALVAAE